MPISHPAAPRRRFYRRLSDVTALALLGLLLAPAGAHAQSPSSEGGQSPAGKAQAGHKDPGKGKADSGKKKDAKPDDDNAAPASKPLPALSPDARYDYQGEATWILQHAFKFHSPYQSATSFQSRDETELSDTYTLYLGARVVSNVEVYVNPEIAWGNGVSSGTGLAGYPNGDVIGQSTLRPDPYLARYFVRWRIPMRHIGPPDAEPHKGSETTPEVQVGRAPNIIDGKIPAHRLVVTVGKFGLTDVFDVNSYANNARAQFMNDAFSNNLAYDYAEETRGYGLGATVAWVNPAFAVRVGTFAMPTTAGGPDLAFSLDQSHGDQIEVELHPRVLRATKPPAIVRLLAYRNVANMGGYRDALAMAAPGAVPDITAVRHSGASKVGFGLNFEQALADGGATGLFGRLGWNDGRKEAYAFVDCDRFLSLGGQLSGAHWHRPDDRVGFAVAQSDISNAHRDFLAAGGIGLTVGDGELRYGSERDMEVYYSYQLTKPLALTADYQLIGNPGYNRDRGPISLVSFRVHFTF